MSCACLYVLLKNRVHDRCSLNDDDNAQYAPAQGHRFNFSTGPKGVHFFFSCNFVFIVVNVYHSAAAECLVSRFTLDCLTDYLKLSFINFIYVFIWTGKMSNKSEYKINI